MTRDRKIMLIAVGCCIVLAVALIAVLTLRGGGGATADKQACADFATWTSDGGANSNFGTYTSLLDDAVSVASKAVGSRARTILDASNAPVDLPGHLLWDLSNVQADAEGRLSPPMGWGDEVAAVQVDCRSVG